MMMATIPLRMHTVPYLDCSGYGKILKINKLLQVIPYPYIEAL